MATRPPDDHGWGLTTISPSPREGIGVMGRRPGPGLNPREPRMIYYRIERGGGQPRFLGAETLFIVF
ncbi:MAG: hypothetical protein QXQ57_06265 [Sulfolobales archaeon]